MVTVTVIVIFNRRLSFDEGKLIKKKKEKKFFTIASRMYERRHFLLVDYSNTIVIGYWIIYEILSNKRRENVVPPHSIRTVLPALILI